MPLITAATDQGLGVVLQTLNHEQQQKKGINLIKPSFSTFLKMHSSAACLELLRSETH